MQQTDLDLNDPIDRHVNRDFVRLRPELTVGEALLEIRRQRPASRIIYFYVLDDQGRLLGVVPTRRLLLSEFEAKLGDVMIHPVISIPHTATVADACENFILHRLLAFPVVDEEQRLVGTIDVEIYTKEVGEMERWERNDDLFQLIGVHMAATKAGNPAVAFRSRFPWLLCNIAGGLVAAAISSLFEADLRKTVALALFVPVTLSLAESVSIQSVSLALQLIRGRQPTGGEIGLWLRREGVVGLLLGLATSGLVALVALLWIGNPRLAASLLLGISGGVAGAAVIGLALPAALHWFDRDPHVAAGPIALAAADMLTLLLYFSLARWLLG
jgi:magnesium transporter